MIDRLWPLWRWTIFAAGDGVWKETVLARLRVGINPEAGVILDRAGNPHGTASAGGTHGFGTVFEVPLSSRGGPIAGSILLVLSGWRNHE